MKYNNLINVKTNYDFLDSTIVMDDYFHFAKKQNFNSVFFTDTNYLYGAAEFEKKASANNLKSVIGCEFKLDDFSFIIYAKNAIGFTYINTLSLLKEELGPKDELNFWKRALRLFDENIILIVNLNFEKDLTILDEIKCEYLLGVNKLNYKFINKTGRLNLVFSERIQSLNEEEYFLLKMLNAIKNLKTVEELEEIKNNYFLNLSELSEYIDVSIHNESIEKISNECSFKIFENTSTHFIKYKNKENLPSDKFIKKICENALNNYLKELHFDTEKNKKYLERLNYELSVINEMNFNDYFLVVSDIVRFAISKNILFGPGRGSAAGSLVSFLLKITSIDPIENDLIFERFLNVQRKTLPDIDIDFEDSRRDEIINYLAEKYSENKFSTIVTFQKIGIKNALRDVGRAFNINSTKINQISKLLSDDNNFDLDFAIKKSLELKKYFQENPQLYKGMKKIIGFPRQSGTHAAGVIFSDINLLEILPIKYNHSGILQTQFPMEFLEELGLIKTDILGLRNLSTIQEIIFQIQKNKDPNFNINKINLEDKDTFKLLESGDTSGIFQLESEGMTNVIMKIKPNSILDIANASSLYRPGPQENIPEFIKRKNKNFKNEKNILDKLLSDTYGIIVYQEQVLNIFTIISKMDLNQADIVRRAISKKDSAKLESVKNDFIQRSIDNGYEKNAVEEIWNYLYKFADYGFNKSHAIAYSTISYWLAYLKTHFKEEFYCALLNGCIRNETKTNSILQEAKLKDIKIAPPTIKNPNNIYFGSDNVIHVPMSIIKGIGPEFFKKLKLVFVDNKKYLDNIMGALFILYKAEVRADALTALISAGVMDCYGYARVDLLSIKENFKDIFKIFDNLKEIEFDEYNLLIDKKENNQDDVLILEKETFGFYLTMHPVTKYYKQVGEKIIKIKNLKSENLFQIILCLVLNIRIIKDKNNNDMAFLTLSDPTGEIGLTIFGKDFEAIKNNLKVNDILLLKIKTQIYKENISCVYEGLVKKFT